MPKVIQHLFGDSISRDLQTLADKVACIRDFDAVVRTLSDEQLRAKTGEFRRRREAGEPENSMVPEAFAIVREAAWRVLRMRHFDVQLMGGLALLEGNIVEMQTGEGKTLVATLPAYVHALKGKGVHIVTVNEYLAERDCSQMGEIYKFLGMTVGCTLQRYSRERKRAAYACDITYGTCSEFGFDYLRDRLTPLHESFVQRPLSCVILDEVDSILIDEARTPLVISGKANYSTALYYKADRWASRLEPDNDFTLDARSGAVSLSERSVQLAEESFRVENLFSPEHGLILHHINQAIRARHLMKRDVDYVISNNEIVIVDEHTGRLMHGRRYSDGLHQAIEAKERLDLKYETQTQATISYLYYYSLYGHLAGMTGTAHTEIGEFKRLYGLNVVRIPPNRPNIRRDDPDAVFATAKEKYAALMKEISRRHSVGQPLLIGTNSVAASERLSDMLTAAGFYHQVLNAKHYAEEAVIVRLAGEEGSITIATNMAGRGTDIMLGEGVRELGGLHVIGTERNISRRIDNQLRGRAGRQGDPGSSQFFVSLEDELLQRVQNFGISHFLRRLKLHKKTRADKEAVAQAIQMSQLILEGDAFNSLLAIIQFDDVFHQQRLRIYRDRDEIMNTDDAGEIVRAMFRSVIERIVQQHCPSAEVPEDWDLVSLAEHACARFLPERRIPPEAFSNLDQEGIVSYIFDRVMQRYETIGRTFGETARRTYERWTILHVVDRHWMDHIAELDNLRQGIHYRAYSGDDPLREYRLESHRLYLRMAERMEEEIVERIANVKLANRPASSAVV